MLHVRASVRARLNTAESQQNINEDFLITMETRRSDIEGIDYAEAIGQFIF